MDIQVASNFERALFEASGRDSGVGHRRDGDVLPATENCTCPDEGARQTCAAAMLRPACDDARPSKPFGKLHAQSGRLIDPHTAVALHAAYQMKGHGRLDRWLCSRPPTRPSSPTP